MDLMDLGMPPHQLAFMQRLLAAAAADERVAAVALVGSYAAGRSDAHSDLDPFVVLTDEGFDDFLASSDAFIRALGEPVFLAGFGHRDRAFFIFEDGTEGDFSFVRASQTQKELDNPFVVLLDKPGMLASLQTPRPPRPQHRDPEEFLTEQLTWFWHDVSHFITASARGQVWWAHGQLEMLRNYCLNLMRLAADFDDPEGGEEPFWKVDKRLPAGELARLDIVPTSLEQSGMRAPARALIALYKEYAVPLAEAHGLAYPAAAERLMLGRLDELG